MAQVRKPRLLDVDGDQEIQEAPGFEAFEKAVDDIRKFQAPFAEAFNEAGKRYVAAGQEAQEEWMNFWKQRLQHNSEIAEQFAKCKTPSDFFELQQDWSRVATEQYGSYLSRLTQIMRETMAHGFDFTKRNRG